MNRKLVNSAYKPYLTSKWTKWICIFFDRDTIKLDNLVYLENTCSLLLISNNEICSLMTKRTKYKKVNHICLLLLTTNKGLTLFDHVSFVSC